MHDIGGGSWRSTNALASIDAEVEMLSGSYREVRRIKAVSYLQVIYGAERNDPEPRTCPVFRVERTSSVHQQKIGNGTFETCRLVLSMSVQRGRPEVVGASSKRRD